MHSLRMRLILSHTLPLLISILLIAIVLIYVLETQVILANLSTQLTRQAALIADIAQDYPELWDDAAAAQAFAERFQRSLSAQIMLLDSHGNLLASGDPTDAPLVGQVLGLSGMAAVRAGRTSVEVDYSQNLHAEVADVLVPVVGSDRQVIGVVRLTHVLATVQERFWRLRYLTLQVLATGLILGISFGLLLAIRLEQPLANLTFAIYRLVSGEELAALPERGPLELRLLVRAFNSLVERLRTLEGARRRLLANLTHELRRPLGALSSATQALLHGASDDVALRTDLLTGIEAELRRLRRLLDNISLLHQQALGLLELNLQPTDLNQWLATVLSPWRAAAREKDLTWDVTLPEPAPTLLIDADRLAQALGNVLSNAVKYTPAGGAIAVHAGVTEDAVWIAVNDTGPGIPLQEQQRIFDPFYRSRANQRFPQGMGLGLSIARELAVAHGGQLEVESADGAGSRFTLRIPLKPPPS